MGVGAALITLGDKGALLHTADGSDHVAAASSGPVVGRRGGGCLQRRLRHGLVVRHGTLQAVRFACAVAGISVTRPGMTPHKWPRQPWFIETGDVHGNGNLIIYTDGSIGETNDLVPK